MDAVQLDMFGDLIDFEKYDVINNNLNVEVEDGKGIGGGVEDGITGEVSGKAIADDGPDHRQSGMAHREVLEQVSAELFQQFEGSGGMSGEGHIEGDVGESGGTNPRNDGQAHGLGDQRASDGRVRGMEDSSAEVSLSASGARRTGAATHAGGAERFESAGEVYGMGHTTPYNIEYGRMEGGRGEALGGVSPELLQESSGTGYFVGDNGKGGGIGVEHGLRSHGREETGEAAISPRSAGDSVTDVHLSDTGTGSGGRGLVIGGKSDYQFSANDDIGAGGKVAKFEANMKAIRLVKSLEEEGKEIYATPEEQAMLVRYTGWGGLSEVFNGQGAWARRHEELKNLLSDDEYNRASRSTLNAHYTDPMVISAVWDAVERMGYKGGPTLEPAAGTGLFFGGRPVHLPVEMHGIEIDPISGRIAQQLYQSADIKISGIQDVKMPKNRYNLAISNVPFGDYSVHENRKNETEGIKGGELIHDHYFIKNLQGVKESGLIAFITSKGTLDKADNDIRSRIAERADFIGAIRLPNNTFKQIADTEVVTDIVFLQKRSPDVSMSELTKEFINTSPIQLPAADGTMIETRVNSYFVAHPEMILGTQDLTGSMYRGNEYTVKLPAGELKDRLTSAVEKLPQGIMNIAVDKNTSQLEPLSVNVEELEKGSFFIGPEGKLWQKKDPSSSKSKISELYEDTKNTDTINRIIGMVEIRDCRQNAYSHQYGGQRVKVAEDIAKLNMLYDTFVEKYGLLNNNKNWKILKDNGDLNTSADIRSLEHQDKENPKIYHKADIFTGLNFHVKQSPTHVDSPIDAMVLSLAKYGNLDIPYMESLTGKNQDELIDGLMVSSYIYQDPFEHIQNGRTVYLTADAYLSGNVREKLRIAEKAAGDNPIFDKNVNALKAAMPRELGPEDIKIRINNPIITESHIRDFIVEHWWDSQRDPNDSDINVRHIPLTGHWMIDCRVAFNAIALRMDNEKYGYNGAVKGDHEKKNIKIKGIDVLDDVMNGRPMTVAIRKSIGKDHYGNEQFAIDVAATAAATAIKQDKADLIAREFANWIWKDADRAKDIITRYNEIFNSHVNRKYIHPERIADPNAKVKLHGCAFPHPLRPHQSDAVWRVMQQKNTMLAHTVGAGKTLEMACAALEMRRLGLRNKPMIVVPNHMINQWAKELREAYPTAKLLIADKKNWDAANRRTFVNQIANGDWDAVIIRSKSFEMIGMSRERQEKFFNDKITEYRSYLRHVEYDYDRTAKRTIKEIEKRVQKYEEKIKSLADKTKDEGILPFEQLGVDHLFIDEADMFKNLEYLTQLKGIKGLGNPMGSARAFDLFMKVQHIQSINGGVTFATGTPISNTLVEAYTMQRFLQPEMLKAAGLQHFDEWVRQYAEAETKWELDNTATNYKITRRLSKIINVQSLMTNIRQGWDIQTAQSLEKAKILVPGENLPYKKVINEAAPSTPLLKSYLRYLEERDSNLSGENKKGQDNILNIITDGRKAAIDLRMINPYLPDDPNSKLNLAVNIIDDLYKKYEEKRYTIAVFFDKSGSYDKDEETGEKTLLFDGVEEMKRKLIEKGIKPDEIGNAGDYEVDKRQELFSKVNEGKVRVIFGTTESMGAGTNFQQYLKAIVHVDAPWRPRDFEQQNGRGYRPGNKTGELEIYNLVTKGTYDTALYNTLEAKANAINQLMDGSDKNTNEIEEDYFGSIKELSVENELVRESIELENSIKVLRLQEHSFNSDVARAVQRIKSSPGNMERANKRFNDIKGDIGTRLLETKGDNFSMTLSGKTYTKRAEAGEQIVKTAKTLLAQSKAAGGKPIETEIGSYAGLKLIIKSAPEMEAIRIGHIYAVGQNLMYPADIRHDSDKVGICNSLHKVIYKDMDAGLVQAEQNITNLKKTFEDDTKLVGSSFPKAEELSAKLKRHAQVLQTIGAQAKDRPKEDVPIFPWGALDGMEPDEIYNAALTFNSLGIVEKATVPIPVSKNMDDVIEAVEKDFFIKMQEKTISMIKNEFTEPKAAYEHLKSALNNWGDSGSGYSWRSGEVSGNYMELVKGSRSPDAGDFVVRSNTADNSFEAYKIVHAGTKQLMGTAPTFEELKTRIETYTANMTVINSIKELQISKIERPPPNQQKKIDSGMDI